MREILFRGKCTDDGEWIEGGVLQIPGYVAICAYSDYHEWHKFVGVLPETLGQYTGLTDKNGKKIFEGDIIKCGKDIGAVDYSETFAKFRVVYNQLSGNWFDFEDDECYPIASECEVIGNIHANPELLKGGSYGISVKAGRSSETLDKKLKEKDDERKAD